MPVPMLRNLLFNGAIVCTCMEEDVKTNVMKRRILTDIATVCCFVTPRKASNQLFLPGPHRRIILLAIGSCFEHFIFCHQDGKIIPSFDSYTWASSIYGKLFSPVHPEKSFCLTETNCFQYVNTCHLQGHSFNQALFIVYIPKGFICFPISSSLNVWMFSWRADLLGPFVSHSRLIGSCRDK